MSVDKFYVIGAEGANMIYGGRYHFSNGSKVTIQNVVLFTDPLTTTAPFSEYIINATTPNPNARSRNGIDVMFGSTVEIQDSIIVATTPNVLPKAAISVHQATLLMQNSFVISNAASLVLADWGTEVVDSQNNVYFSFFNNTLVDPDDLSSMNFGNQGHIFSVLSNSFSSINDSFYSVPNTLKSIYNIVGLPNRPDITGFNFDYHLSLQSWIPSTFPIASGAMNISNSRSYLAQTDKCYFYTIVSNVPGTIITLSNLVITQPIYFNVPNGGVILQNLNIKTKNNDIFEGTVGYLEISGSTLQTTGKVFSSSNTNIGSISMVNTVINAPDIGSLDSSSYVEPYQPIYQFSASDLAISAYQPNTTIRVNSTLPIGVTITLKNGTAFNGNDVECKFEDLSRPDIKTTAEVINGTCTTLFNGTVFGVYNYLVTLVNTTSDASIQAIQLAPINVVDQVNLRYFLGYIIAEDPVNSTRTAYNYTWQVGCLAPNCQPTGVSKESIPQYSFDDPNFALFDYGFYPTDPSVAPKITLNNIPPAFYKVTLYFVYYLNSFNQSTVLTMPGSYSAKASTSSTQITSIGAVGTGDKYQFKVKSQEINVRVLDSDNGVMQISWQSTQGIFLTALSLHSDFINIPTPKPTKGPDSSSGGGNSSSDKLLPLKIVLPIAGAVLLVALFILIRKKRRARSIRMDIEMQSQTRSQLNISKGFINDNKYNLHSEVFHGVQQTNYYSPEHETFPLTFSTTRLDFGIGDAKSQINQKMRDTIIITNKSDQTQYITLFFPPSNSGRIVECQQTELVLKRGKIVTIDVDVTLLCTTKLMEKFGVLIKDYGHTFLYMHLESMLSTYLDYEEIQIGDPIGSGGYGSVFRSKWRGLEVAVKVIRTKHCSADVVKEVERECDLMNRLRHPNVVNYFGTALHDGDHYLVSEYVPLGSVANVIYNSEPPRRLAMNEIIRVCLDTAKGCNFLHQSGIMHRDLKPDNLLVVSLSLDSPVCIKLTDFGTSKEVNSMASENATSGIGTPVYMAPEILLKKPYGTQADVYSFGIMLYELVIGEIPFDDLRANWEIPRFILDGQRPTKGLELAPPTIRQLIEECWRGEPDERPTFDTIIPRLEEALITFSDMNTPPTNRNTPIFTLNNLIKYNCWSIDSLRFIKNDI
ncbi:putative transmembrane protein [Heterostelium album PN500]|uniref:Putative transmembrane protein n=1 Tax=Heterostelium pallidum (strain ATCC 26659 / Pp 5 / PN500) TaxID=670386 RepID=D3AY38_HETP5|nr:putative transmembrane protein [Heterostelium album PN500]EFA85865.1 putative transmembrane protein [Heterostelium album PN500]|eukprot:XP_020437971.1 putative transmembrane protein [Heterostelium album PN500]